MPNTKPPIDEIDDVRTPLKQRILLWLVVGGLMVPVGRWLNDGTMTGDRAYMIVTMLLIGFLIAPIKTGPTANVIERKNNARQGHSNTPQG